MKRLNLLAVGMTGMLLVPGQAKACMLGDALVSLIHDALPQPFPRGTIVADVVFDRGNADALNSTGIRARVRRKIQGDYHGRTLIVRQRIMTSCDDPFGNGSAGLIVAVPVDTQDGILVVAPILVSRLHRRRLPDRYQIPEPQPGAIPLQQ